jgi:alpha-amylase/alpha-mannosidase (GH57 family)
MTRYVCIHGHFYQPPRENPWLEAIERQESARPYHDWNERISAECYATNGASRILDDQGRIAEIVNNYGLINFNFGPTLLAWLEEKDPETYEAVLDADRESQRRFAGHGSGIAQAYNHMILPLANERDRRTQILWGIKDFEHRFGRFPEGMWLPETAVDLLSLDLMAEAGIRYTILAPRQAASVRAPDSEHWSDVRESTLEIRRPYRVLLPSGREIAVFFYQGPLSRAVAFERLLTDGAAFADRLVRTLDGYHGEPPPLVHIATDGETYGHHHRHGEMGLSYALRQIEALEDVSLINYGGFLEKSPPTWEARIHENSSWSCAHGIERWRSDCGCSGGRGGGWNQRWRTPLRAALDLLRDQVAPLYEAEAGRIFRDPWLARDRYIDVVLDRAPEPVAAWFQEMAGRSLEGTERSHALKLLELQRHGMLMYTSCGWFFDDISGIETEQVLQYAGRVIQLAQELFGEQGQRLEEPFLEQLAQAESNVPERGSGQDVYLSTVSAARVDLRKAGAHFAVSSIFEEHPEQSRTYSFLFRRRNESRFETGQEQLLIGQVDVSSVITEDVEKLSYAVLHLGNHNVVGGVRPFGGREAYDQMSERISTPFLRTDFTTVIRMLDREFEASTYSLRSLFRDAQRRIVDQILEASIEEAEENLTRLYEQRAPLLRFLSDLQIPQPKPFKVAAEYVLNTRLQRIFRQPDPKLQAVQATLEQVRSTGVELEARDLSYAARRALERIAERLEWEPKEVRNLRKLRELCELVLPPPLAADPWRVQNVFYRVVHHLIGDQRRRAESGNESAADWLREVERLGEVLRVAVPSTAPRSSPRDGVSPDAPAPHLR